jgi:hypothetical protein
MARSRGRVERARGSTSQPHSRDGDGIAGSGERVRSEARKPNKPTRRARFDRKVGQPTHRRRSGFFVPSPLTGWRPSKSPGSTGQLRSLTKDGLCRANARRRPRGSARRATEDVRRRAVGDGSLSRRTQRVTSLRERSGRKARDEVDRLHQLACFIRHHGGSCRGKKPRHRRTGTAARTARPASLRNRHGPTMPRGRLATAARRVRTIVKIE